MMSYLGRIREQAECLYGDSGVQGLDSIVCYCCITSYHKLNGFKQHTFIFSVCVGQDPGHGSAQGLTRLPSRCQVGLQSHLRLD